MSIADYLTSINNSKAAIKTAIKNKGVSIDDSTTLSDYAAKIDSIPAGGGTDNSLLADYMNGTLTRITKENLKGCIKIMDSGFSNNAVLVSIDIPDGCVSIGTHAFLSNTSLTTVSIPSTVTTMGASIFTGSSKLATINVNKKSGTLSGSPWGATSATVNWTGTN